MPPASRREGDPFLGRVEVDGLDYPRPAEKEAAEEPSEKHEDDRDQLQRDPEQRQDPSLGLFAPKIYADGTKTG
ncbi:MAG: hypothetical protein ACTHN7_11590 [Solirubrobacterales bacterium]